MSKSIDLKQLERQAYLSYHGDGILDLFLGAVIIWVTILFAILPEFFIFLIGSFVALLPSYTSAKKSFTVPRMGYVEFSASRQWNTKILFMVFNIVLVFGVLAGMLAWLVPPVTVFIVTYYLFILGLAGFSFFCATGLVTGMRRFHGYGLIVLVGFIITHLLGLSMLLPLFLIGFVITAYGAILLYRFTKKYPKSEAAHADWRSDVQRGYENEGDSSNQSLDN